MVLPSSSISSAAQKNINGLKLSMVVSGSLNRWDRYHIIPQKRQEIYHLYTTYSPCQLGDYMVPIPPTKGTRKLHWHWVVPLPSNSHHRDYYFLVGNPYKPSVIGMGDKWYNARCILEFRPGDSMWPFHPLVGGHFASLPFKRVTT